MLTTDSDTYVHPDAVKNMMALLFSDDRIAGVTGDVRIWNKSDSFLALMSSIRYWFAFNVERACQSAFGCVGCLSGPVRLISYLFHFLSDSKGLYSWVSTELLTSCRCSALGYCRAFWARRQHSAMIAISVIEFFLWGTRLAIHISLCATAIRLLAMCAG